MDGPIVDVAPNRAVHAILGPDGAVREADLAATHHLALRFAHGPDPGRDLIRFGKAKIDKTLRERLYLPLASEHRERFVGNGIEVSVVHVFALRSKLHGRRVGT